MANWAVPDPIQLKAAHDSLMGAYASALRDGVRLRFLGIAGFGFFVRFLVKSHVRTQLKHLTAAYLVVEQAAASKWRYARIAKAREQLERTVAALSNLRGQFAAFSLLPTVATLVALGGAFGMDSRTTLIVALVVGLVYVVAHAWHGRKKKAILASANVYELEKALFGKLPLGRHSEIPDVVIVLALIIGLMAVGAWFLL